MNKRMDVPTIQRASEINKPGKSEEEPGNPGNPGNREPQGTPGTPGTREPGNVHTFIRTQVASGMLAWLKNAARKNIGTIDNFRVQ